MHGDRTRSYETRSWTRGWMSDSAQLFVSQGLTVVATTLAAIAIARSLQPDDWAIFSAFLGLSMALSLVADFGIGTWLLRELSSLLVVGGREHRSIDVGRLVSSGVFVNAAIALPLVIGAVIWSVSSQPGAGVATALVSLLVYGVLTAAANALEAHFRARRMVRLVLGASVLEKGILIALVLATAAADAGLGAIGLAYVAAGLTRVGFDAFVLFGRHGVPLVRPTPRAGLALARKSFPLALNAASLNLVPRLDALVLIAMSTTSAAWFAVGERVLGPAFLLPAAFGSALYPFMATHDAKRAAPWKIAGALAAVGAALAVTGLVLAPFLIPLLFGETYREAVPVSQVMLLVVPIAYATSPLLVIAYSHGRERSLLVPFVLLSLGGTVAIIVGQAVGGATLAAVGYVARSALFLIVIGSVAFVAWRRHLETVPTDEVAAPSRVSAHTT
jgi:O-antigen/teichoic acid export membrane protein